MGLKDCTHHWDIEIAKGPRSKGICLNCGMKKSFRNSIGEDRHFTQIDAPRDSDGNLLEDSSKRRRKDIVIGWRDKEIAEV